MKIAKMKRDSLLQIKAEALNALTRVFQKRNDLFLSRSRRTLRTDRNWLLSNEDRPEMSNAEMLKKKHSPRSKFNSKARSSVEERYIDIVEVVSSILSAPIALLGGVSKFFNVYQSSVDQVVWLIGGNRQAFCCLAAPSRRTFISAVL